MRKILLSLVCLFLLEYTNAQTHVYTFQGNFDEFGNVGPSLTEVLSCGATSGSYTNQVINTIAGNCSVASPQVFAFNEGGGLSYPNNSFITGSYTINLFFEFNFLNGYQRIIDFKNSTTDRGMYILGNCLNFYPNGNVGTCPFFVANTYYLITIVRDAATNLVNVYVNGNPFVVDYNDALNDYSPTTTTTPIIFFRDDIPVACEDRDGTIKYLSLQASTSTPAEILDLWNNICAVVLPLKLDNFAAQRMANYSLLNWQTSNEINVSHFEVERSFDGQNFNLIKSVNSNPSANNTYTYNDFSTFTSGEKTIFYRLKMVDKDAKFTYSKIVKLEISGKVNIAIMPNPTKDYITINGVGTYKFLEIVDANGKVVKRMSRENDHQYKIAGLASGIYMLRIINDKKIITSKIIIQ
jgi:Secretion system C-terminal sorting domain